MQQINSTMNGIFLQQHPRVTFPTGFVDNSDGEGWGERGRLLVNPVSCCMSTAVRFRASCYFVVLPFILQSKGYPRNVPGNPTRKCVEKEVCKKNNPKCNREIERVTEKRSAGSVSFKISPAIKSGTKMALSMKTGPGLTSTCRWLCV